MKHLLRLDWDSGLGTNLKKHSRVQELHHQTNVESASNHTFFLEYHHIAIQSEDTEKYSNVEKNVRACLVQDFQK